MATLYSALLLSGARGTDGLPIASGYAYFYVRGSTSEFQTVYNDAEETTPVNARVPLDAAGRAAVYITAPADLVIKDATGAIVQFQVEDATGVDAGLVEVTSAGFTGTTLPSVLSAIAASLGGTDGKYKESSATGCVARTIHDMLDSSISPYDFGAIGDGSADDTVPLQRAIARAIAAKVPLKLDTGSFKITANLQVNGALSIYGNGAGQSKIIATSESFDAITVTVPNGNLNDGYTWQGFSVLIPYTSGYGNQAVVLAAGNYGSFVNVVVAGSGGFDAHLVYGCRFSDCYASIQGSAGHVVAAFNLGALNIADACTANCNPSAGTVHYTIGFKAAAHSNCMSCYAIGADLGFYNSGSGTSPAIFQTCLTTTCNTGYSVAASTNTVFIGCIATTSATADYANPNSAAVTILDSFGQSDVVPASSCYVDVNAGVSPDSGGVVGSARRSVDAGGGVTLALRIHTIAADMGGNMTMTVTLSGAAAFASGIDTIQACSGRTTLGNPAAIVGVKYTAANVFVVEAIPTTTADGQRFNVFVTLTGK
jgi:hypothetical protein